MRSFMLRKLVRDKVFEDMQHMGQQMVFHELNDTDYVRELVAKLSEESGELSVSDRSEALKELADVLEVVESLAVALDADFDKVRAVQAERKAKRGGFEKRVFVERLDLADDDPWVDYYAKEPERFPEIKE